MTFLLGMIAGVAAFVFGLWFLYIAWVLTGGFGRGWGPY